MWRKQVHAVPPYVRVLAALEAVVLPPLEAVLVQGLPVRVHSQLSRLVAKSLVVLVHPPPRILLISVRSLAAVPLVAVHIPHNLFFFLT
jgi:hypothetical protein